jgi:hypothetical protein
MAHIKSPQNHLIERAMVKKTFQPFPMKQFLVSFLAGLTATPLLGRNKVPPSVFPPFSQLSWVIQSAHLSNTNNFIL